MPIDSRGNVIPCINLRNDGGTHRITTSTTSGARNTTPFRDNTVIVSLFSTTDVFIRFNDTAGDPVATSSDHFFPANTYYSFDLGGRIGEGYADPTPGRKFISALAVSLAGTLYISECA